MKNTGNTIIKSHYKHLPKTNSDTFRSEKFGLWFLLEQKHNFHMMSTKKNYINIQIFCIITATTYLLHCSWFVFSIVVFTLQAFCRPLQPQFPPCVDICFTSFQAPLPFIIHQISIKRTLVFSFPSEKWLGHLIPWTLDFSARFLMK